MRKLKQTGHPYILGLCQYGMNTDKQGKYSDNFRERIEKEDEAVQGKKLLKMEAVKLLKFISCIS